jgi:hypothetical protein
LALTDPFWQVVDFGGGPMAGIPQIPVLLTSLAHAGNAVYALVFCLNASLTFKLQVHPEPFVIDTKVGGAKLFMNGTIVTIAGNGTQGYSGDHGQVTRATLPNPTGISFGLSGSLYIAD